MRPSCAAACSTMRRTAASSPVSQTIGIARRPLAAAISRAASTSGASVRAASTTSTPSAASAAAIALPIPRLPPVMMAARPSSCRSIVCLANPVAAVARRAE